MRTSAASLLVTITLTLVCACRSTADTEPDANISRADASLAIRPVPPPPAAIDTFPEAAPAPQAAVPTPVMPTPAPVTPITVGPALPELTFQATSRILFDLTRAALAHLEPKGVMATLPGVSSTWAHGRDPELMTRLMESVAGWLSRPSRPAVVTAGGVALDMEALMLKALQHGPDPQSSVYWGGSPGTQMDVEAAIVAFSVFLTADRILPRLSEAHRAHLAAWLRVRGSFANATNNWNMFYVVNNAVLKRLGWPHNQNVLDVSLGRVVNDFYRGDGWYSDGQLRVFDEYNNHVFGSHVAQWAWVLGDENPTLRREVLARLRRFIEDQPYFYAASGRTPEFGRSMAYKMARLCAMILAYHLDRTFNTPTRWNLPFRIFPESISVGQFRRLIRLQLNQYLTNGAIEPGPGLITQRVAAGGSLQIAESYIAPGSTYWGLRAYGNLMLLADDDPLWSTAEEPLAVESRDYNRWLTTPGFLMSGHQKSGHVQQYNAGSSYGTRWEGGIPQYILKYSKFVYSSDLGYLTAADGDVWRNPDNMISIGVGDQMGHRTLMGSFARLSSSDRGAVLSQNHRQTVGGQDFAIQTVLFVKEDFHLRVHRIATRAAGKEYVVREGGYPLGLSARNTAKSTIDPAGRWVYQQSPEGAVLVGTLLGNAVVRPDIDGGWKREGDDPRSAHTRYPFYVLPHLEFSQSRAPEQVVATLVVGRAKPFDPAEAYAAVKSVAVEGATVSVRFGDGTTQTGAFAP